MIASLRQTLQGHASRIFLWLFLIMMIVGGLSNFDYNDTSKWVIKVYKQKMTELDWRQSLVTAQRQLDYIASLGINWPRTEPIEKDVLRSSVSKLLLQHVAQEMDLRVPSILVQDKLAEVLQGLPAHFFDESGQLNIAMLERQIAPRTFESFVVELEDEIRSGLIHSIASIGSYIPSFEVALQFNEDYADKKYTVLTFSLEKALKKAQKDAVSDEVLERFYKKSEHGDTYKSAEKRSGVCWKFSAHDYGLSISDQEVSAHYDKNKHSEYLENPAQVKVHRIFIVDGPDAREQIDAIAQEVSQDQTSFAAVAKKIAASKKSHQGAEQTDFFAKDSTKYDKILVETAFEQLSKDGDVSDVIKTDKGYEILQRVSRKSAQYKTLSDVKGQISAKLLEEKFAKRFQQDAQRITGNADYNDRNAIHAFIEKRKGRKEVLNSETKKPGLINMNLFKTEKDHFMVFMDGKDGVILQCTDIVKKTLKPFHEVRSAVAADYYNKQAQKDLETIAQKAMQQAATADLHEVAQQFDAEITTAESVYKDGKTEDAAILRRPEISKKIKGLQSAGEMVDVITPTESLLIRLDAVSEVNEQLFEEKKNSLKNILASKAKYQGRDSFIASLYRRAKLNDKIEIKVKDIKEIE